MAVAIASTAQTHTSNTAWSLTSIAWSSGDVIVVAGAMEDDTAGFELSTPTNANLTFTRIAAQDTATGVEGQSSIYAATAGSSQSGQTISLAISGGAGRSTAWQLWVLTGASGSVGNTANDNAEAALSLTVSAGSAVFYMGGDFLASANNETPATGSGTATERYDGVVAGFGAYAAEWLGTSAGTFTFGPNSYTGWQSAQCVVELLSGSGDATATPAAIVVTTTMDAATETGNVSAATGQWPNVGRFTRNLSLGNGSYRRRRIRTLYPTALGDEQYGAASQTANKLAIDYFWGVQAAAGNATASPATIVSTTTMDGSTESADSLTIPAVIAAVVALDAVTASLSYTPTPATIVSTTTMDGSTEIADSSTVPATIATVVSMDAASETADSSTTPTDIAAVVSMDATSASASQSATPTPTEIAVTTTMDGSTEIADSSTSPTTILAVVALDASTVTTTGSASPAEIAVTAALDAVAATGTGSATATPTEIVASVVIDAVTAQAGSTATVTEIATVAVFDPVSASGGTSATPTPATIITSVAMDAVTVIYGATATPGEIVVLVSIPALAASGTGTSLNGYVVLTIRAAKVILS